jgi:DNA-binding response OmpR family regulator
MVLGRRKDETWNGKERRAPAVVLIVNDDPDACEMVVRFVGAKGYRAIGAGSLEEAVGHLGADLPRCVVLDLDAGGVGTSLKVLDLVRGHGDRRVSDARVVLCAASPKNRTFSFQSGADSFVLRPFHIDDLVAQIADVLDRPDKDRARHRRDELNRIGE